MAGAAWWKTVRLQSSGPVVRHMTRATATADEETKRLRLRRENAACTAGLRQAARVIAARPHLIECTRPLFSALRRARLAEPAGAAKEVQEPACPTTL